MNNIVVSTSLNNTNGGKHQHQNVTNGRKSKSKDYSAKNKTFEFPQGYLKSMINSNTEFLVEGSTAN